MKSIDLIVLALKNFLRRKVRSLLTILGVTIGTAAVVVMLSLGIGMSEGFQQQLEMMGSLTTIEVNRYYSDEGNTKGGRVEPATIDDKVIEQISKIKGVKAVTPIMRQGAILVSGKYISYVNLYGVYPDALEDLGYVTEQGRLLRSGESETLLFGADATQNFYNPKNTRYGGMGGQLVNVMTDRLQLTLDNSYGQPNQNPNQKPAKLYKVKTAGTLQRAQGEQDWNVIVDIDFLKKIVKEYNSSQGAFSPTSTGYDQATVKVTDINQVENVVKEIRAMKLGTFSLQDIQKGMKDQLFMIQAVLGGIGAISLLVAALGITNTMVMSIYERTREIGVMKVLGCVLTDIRKLFLLEAGIIGFSGGLIGLLLSLGASWLLNHFGGNLGGFFGGGGYSPDGKPLPISLIPLWLACSSVGFATTVGLISGFYPANRAMKLSALEAIRSE